MPKKKIVFINNNFQKSDGTVATLIQLCNNLDSSKFDITIVPLYNCDSSLISSLSPSIKVKKAFGFYFKGFNRLVRLIPASFLYRKFIGSDFDIEIGFQCDNPTRIVGYKKKKSKVQACWMHGYAVYPKFFRNCDKIVCVSRSNAEKCKEQLKDSDNVDYLYNLLDDKDIVAKSQADYLIPHREGPLFVTVGRLSPEKGFDRLIQILYDLRQEGYIFRLMIIGGGPQEKSLSKLISKLSMQDSIYLMGKLDNPHCITRQADLFICSSLSEGYNTACCEAAILNVPVLTTSVSGAQELIDDCHCGLICGLDNQSLKDSIRFVLDHPSVIDDWKQVLEITKANFYLNNRIHKVNAIFDDFYRLSIDRES